MRIEEILGFEDGVDLIELIPIYMESTMIGKTDDKVSRIDVLFT